MTRMNLWKPAQLGEYALARLLACLPVNWTSDIGAFLGKLQARKGIKAKRKWVSRLHANFAHFRGIHSATEREKHIQEFIARVGRVYAEFMVLQKIVNQGRLEIVGKDVLSSIERPIIVVSCHISNWELVGHVMAQLKRPVCALYLPPTNPVRHQLALEARQRWGTQSERELVAASSSILRQVSKAIQRGNNVLIFIDEEKDGYVSAPSLGRTIPYAGNRWYAARLAVKHDLDILPVFIEPTANGSYRAVIEPVIKVPQGENTETQAKQLADTLDEKLNAWIEPRLEHWYWLPNFELGKRPSSSKKS